jgi:rhamnosyl/mannosyltransferase
MRLAHDHDVIHYHFPWPFADIMHLALQTRSKSVMTYHSDIVKQSVLSRFYSPVMWRMLVSMDKIVATSPAYAASSKILTDRRIIPRLCVIPLGIQDIFSGNAPPPQPSDESDPYFLFIGALRYYKGLPFLLKAAKSVSARILVAGEGNQGAALRRMAQELGCSNVEFLGNVTDEKKFRLLKGCRAFVMPSDERSEAFGVALIEAAMYGRPMISTEIRTGTSYINSHMSTGFVVPPKNSAALANAMNALLQNPELARSFGVKARDRYRVLFSGASLGSAYSDLYEEILSYGAPLPTARATKPKTSRMLSRSSGSPW